MDARTEEMDCCPLPDQPVKVGTDGFHNLRLRVLRVLLDHGCYDVPAMAVAERIIDGQKPADSLARD